MRSECTSADAQDLRDRAIAQMLVIPFGFARRAFINADRLLYKKFCKLLDPKTHSGSVGQDALQALASIARRKLAPTRREFRRMHAIAFWGALPQVVSMPGGVTVLAVGGETRVSHNGVLSSAPATHPNRVLQMLALSLAPKNMETIAFAIWERYCALLSAQVFGRIAIGRNMRQAFTRLLVWQLQTIKRYAVERKAWIGVARGALSRFVRTLDPEAVRCYRSLSSPISVSLLEWLACESATLRRNRIQAAYAFPALIYGLFTDRHVSGDDGEWNVAEHDLARSAVCRAIDAGGSLLPALAEAYEVPQGLIRRWRGITPQRLQPLANCCVRDLVATSLLLPACVTLVSRKDYHALQVLVHSRLLRSVRLAWRGRSPPRDWGQDRRPQVLSKWFGPEAVSLSKSWVAKREVPQQLAEVDNLIRSLIETTSYGDVESDDRFEVEIERFVLAKTWMGLLRLSGEWHAAVIDASIQTARSSVHWTPAMPAAFIDDDWSVVELSDAVALAEEGQHLTHCVGDYVIDCIRGACRIFSVRDAEGRPVSTIEVNLEGDHPVVRQHAGRKNETPPREALSIECRWIDAVHEGRHPFSRSWREEQRVPQSGQRKMLGFWSRQTLSPALRARVQQLLEEERVHLGCE